MTRAAVRAGLEEISEHTCTDSGEWHKKGDDEKDCAWVASHPSEARCLVRGEDDTLAKDACPSACAPQ